MNKHLPTFSSLARLMACPGSFALSHVLDSSEYAETGTDIHSFLETVAESPAERRAALALVSVANRARCAAIDIAATLDGFKGVETEVAFRINVISGKAERIGKRIGRQYPPAKESGDVCGTVDVLATRGGIPVVQDWKTGRETEPVKDNWQMRIQALAVAQFTGAGSVVARICYIHDDGSHWIDEYTFDVFELESLLAMLARAHHALIDAFLVAESGRVPDVAPGSHCQYCPAFDACPAKVALARAMGAELADLSPRIATLSPVEAGNAWTKAKQIEMVLEGVLDALKERAKRDFIPLASGKVVAPVESTRMSLDASALTALAESLGATPAQLASCQRRVPVVQIREIKRKGEAA